MKQALILLPGMLADDAFWGATVTALADVCAPAVVDYGLADSIGEMAQIVIETAPPRFALAGHSMGGRVALEVVKRAPDRVTRLALLGADFRGPAPDASDWKELEAAARSGGMRRAAAAWVQHAVPREADAALVSEIEAMVARQTPARLAAQSKAGRTRPDHSDLLAAIACPTLVLAGERDRLRPVEGQAEMAARIHGAHLVVVAGAGHMLAMECPDAVNDALRSWLTNPPKRRVGG